MHTERYGRPSSLRTYLPDPDEPLDRWLRADNASNVRSIVSTVEDLITEPAAVFVDPFAGGGSSGAAARLMGLPFLGIELDPVSASATAAKVLAAPHHVPMLRRGEGQASELPWTSFELQEAAVQSAGTVEDLAAVAYLRLIQRLRAAGGRPIGEAELKADLAVAPGPAAGSRVVCGDCTTWEPWARLGPPAGQVVSYTSPPFGLSSPRMAAPERLRMLARQVLAEAGSATSAVNAGPAWSYFDLTMAMLRQFTTWARRATAIIEHEPADDGEDCRAQLVSAIESELGHAVSSVRVLETGAFSWRGTLSLLVLEVRT